MSASAPLVPEEKGRRTSPIPPPGPIPRILLVEDDAAVASDLSLLLRNLGYQVVETVREASAALAFVQSSEADLALIDVGLSGESGDKVGKVLTRHFDIPVVYVTAYSDDFTLSRLKEARAAGLVLKPFTRQEIRGAVELALGEARLRRELQRREEGYRALFELNAAGVLRQTAGGEVLECNHAFARLFGYPSPERLMGRSSEVFYMAREDREEFVRRLQEEGVVRNLEVRMRRADGSALWVLDNSMLLREPHTGRQIILSTLLDVSERKAREEDLTRMAYQDPLTGLANRRRLEDVALRSLALAERQSGKLALFFLDLVSFKRVNDAHGHRIGDQVLESVAGRLDEELRQADLAARVGGDEFAVILADVDSVDAARLAADRLRARLEVPIRTEEGEVAVGVRIAVAVYPLHGADWESLLRRADSTLAKLKRGGGAAVGLVAAP